LAIFWTQAGTLAVNPGSSIGNRSRTMMDTVPTVTADNSVFDSNPEPAVPRPSRLNFYYQPRPREDLVGELLDGLRHSPRSIDPKFFYDSAGAQLFDHITRLPEYYPCRVERQIYQNHRLEIAAELGTG